MTDTCCALSFTSLAAWTAFAWLPKGTRSPTLRSRGPRTATGFADEARKWLGTERMRVMVLAPGSEGRQQVGGCLWASAPHGCFV